VTEAEWLACQDPEALVPPAAGNRPLRLFVCACGRQLWHLLTDARSRRAVQIGERFADGLASEDERAAAWEKGSQAVRITVYGTPDHGAARAALNAVHAKVRVCVRETITLTIAAAGEDARQAVPESERSQAGGWQAREAARADMRATLCALLRDIFDNPFRPTPAAPCWRTSDVIALARGIYDGRHFEDMAILADALEEAGCADEHVLSHCRQGGRHVRGCWLLDRCLEKR
jgi:hypothetical protein